MVAAQTDGNVIPDGRGQRGDRNYVTREQIEEIVRESGLPTEEKAAFVKVMHPERSDVGIYYPKRMSVSRVDISGFELAEEHGVEYVDLDEDERPSGRVHQQMSMDGDEKEILKRFKKLLGHLKKLKAEEVIQPRRGAVRAVADQPAAKRSSRGRGK